ncbi:uncharacterized protein LOC142980162 [Anticarsia gemmatalis]|uniref:uncharacterized protein LOC142980162 n=1 Tax=Anticarsia gemmatalis TaxID=129554 RepID=UPI003F76918C
MERRYTAWDVNWENPLQFQQTLNTLIETLIKPETLKRDLFFALLLIVIKENDFVLKGNTEINVVDYILSKRRKNDTVYEVSVILKRFQDTPAKIIASPLTDMMLINAIIPDINKETYSLCFEIDDYIITGNLGAPSSLSNLDELVLTFREKILIPVKSCILNFYNHPSSALHGLPDDVLYEILLCLPVADILSLSQSCKRLRKVLSGEDLWFLLYRRDFCTVITDESVRWRDMYKDAYVRRQDIRYETGYQLRNDVIEENVEPVRDSEWTVIF